MVDKLPDKGAKLRKNLRESQDELDRRKLAAYQKKDTAQIWPGERAKTPDLCVLQDVPSPNYAKSEPCPKAPSFGSLFSQRLESKAGAASKEELRFVNQNKFNTRLNKKWMCEEKRPTGTSLLSDKMSYRQSQFKCASIYSDKYASRSSNGACLATASPSISSCAERNISSCFTKRPRYSEVREPLNRRQKKTQHVVLLDEEEEQSKLNIDNSAPNERKEVTIYYPSRDNPEAVEISYSDIKCLDPEQFLTSPIMNFYMRYLERPSKTGGRFYFFNTYFYKKLEQAMTCKGDRSVRFSKLRRWWKGVNLFQKAYIFLPIHEDLHWSLVIICMPAKENESGPILLHLDSLKLHSSNLILDIVASYLKEEWNYLMQHDRPQEAPFSERIWKNLPRRIERETIVPPQQNNDYDCGLFVLYYMERFIAEAPERLRKKDLSMFGKGWFKPQAASGLRQRIRDLLTEEFENSRLDNCRTESPTSSSDAPVHDTKQGDKS